MKTKSKLMMISSFALAMVASLVMAFAMMNVTKAEPASVNADGTPAIDIYLDNINGWTTVYSNPWGGTGSSGGSQISATVDNHYYHFDNSTGYANISFREKEDWSGDNNGQNIAISTDYAAVIYQGKNRVWDGEPYNGTVTEYTAPTTKTVYYSKPDGWAEVYAYVWKEGGVSATARIFDSNGDDWFELTYDEYYELVIFKNTGAGVWDKQTANIELDEDTPYIYGNDAYELPVSGASVALTGETDPVLDNNAYYIVGFINGKIGWAPSMDSINLDGTTYGSNVAQKYQVYLHKGDVIKVKRNNGGGSASDGWFGGQTSNTEGGSVSVATDNGNITIHETGYYNVYVDGDTNRVWLTKVLQKTKSKFSVEGKYLLLITGFQYLADSPAVEIGYTIEITGAKTATINTYDNVYYNAVNLDVTAGKSRITCEDLYGAANEEIFGLIVYELDYSDYIGCNCKVTVQIRNASTHDVIDSYEAGTITLS